MNPSTRGAETTALTVLTDADCPLCRSFAAWLGQQALLVPLEVLPAGSAEARRRYPALDHGRTLEEVTVVGADGAVWTQERAWVMCLWATRAHRGLAERLATPRLLPLARGAAYGAAGLRHLLGSGPTVGGDYADRCAGTCALPKAEHTRRTIVDAATRLFRESGYGRTTMRAIAAEAGVSLGNAYYYFGSKEHLVQAFYDQLQAEHAAAAERVLAGDEKFDRRLRGVLLAWLDVARPHHEFAGQFFRNAADPHSPLSPFSPESAPARDASIALFARVLEGSDAKPLPALRGELPQLLWLLQMGVVLFWVYDDSPGQQRSRELVTRSVPVVDRLVRLSRLPVIRGVVDDVLGLLRAIRSPS